MYSNFSGKTWFSASREDSAAATNYIGVTPLKTYRITVDYGSEIDGTGSEKQMKWYEEILKEAYDYLDARYNHLKANGMIMNLVFFMAVAFMLGAAAGVATAK